VVPGADNGVVSTHPAQSGLAFGELGLRLGVDVVALLVLVVGFSYRRHHRHDLVVLYVTFNCGLLAAVITIQEGEVGAAVGFGLFAVLSIIRLRAETLTNPEIAYFFAAIVLGLVCGIDLGGVHGNAALSALVLAAPGIADHPSVLRGHAHLDVTLDSAVADVEAVRRLLESRLGGRVVAVDVTEIDFVRDVTRVDVRLDRDQHR
jgi:hypothetical protein